MPGFFILQAVSLNNANIRETVFFYDDKKEKVDIAAWGREVYSCFPDGESGILDGTSMAAGYVSAAAALAVSVSGTEGLKGRLMDTADRLSCLQGKIAQGNKVKFFRRSF